MKSSLSLTLTCALILALLPGRALPATAAVNDGTLITVRPSAMSAWVSSQESASGSVAGGNVAFVAGPASPPIGIGSAQITVTSNLTDQVLSHAVPGVRLDNFTKITYATLVPTDALATALQFTIDLTVTDGIMSDQGRLVFDPALQSLPITRTWPAWDALSGLWYATPEAGPLASMCTFAAPCSLPSIIAQFPNIGLHPVTGGVFLVAPRNLVPYVTYVDDLILGISGDTTSYNFEPEVACLSVCWVDAAAGSDMFGGSTPDSAKRTIQAAIDAVSPGGVVRVRPGAYNETASGRFTYNSSGPHTFGLVVPVSKAGITIQGVTGSNAVIGNWASTVATITTNATNSFGPSGIYIEADNVTLSGLRIGNNSTPAASTLDIIGDNFSLLYSAIAAEDGVARFRDARYNPLSGASHIQSFRVEGNGFSNNSTLHITNGAGASGPASARLIQFNEFQQDGPSPSIQFNGGTTGSSAYVHPVGGAWIKFNGFINSSPHGIHLRSRGNVIESQMDWSSIWYDNTYNRAALVGENAPVSVRPYAMTDASGVYTNARGINTSIQSQIDIAAPSDMVLVKAGQYDEALSINTPLHVRGAGAGVCARTRIDAESVIRSSGMVTTPLDIRSDDVTIDGFTFNADGSLSSWIATAHAHTANPRFSKLRFLNNVLIGNSAGLPGGLHLENQDDLLIECNYFNDLGGYGALVAPATPGEAGSNFVVFRNNDSNSNAQPVFATDGTGHSTVWVRNNRLVHDTVRLGAVNEAIVIGNAFTGTAGSPSGLVLDGGNASLTVSDNRFTAMQGPALLLHDNGLGANRDITITANTVSAAAASLPEGTALFDVRSAVGDSAIHSNTLTLTGSTTRTVSAIAIGGAVALVDVFSNVLTGPNLVTSTTPSTGILLSSTLTAGTQINIDNNSITRFEHGLRNRSIALGLSINATNNDLSDNTAFAVRNEGNGTLNAPCNWYGNGFGPGGAGGGPGAPVSVNVRFDPWRSSPDFSEPCATPTLTIQQVVIGLPPGSVWQFTTPLGAVTAPAAGGAVVLNGLLANVVTITQQPKEGFATTASCSTGNSGTTSVTFALSSNTAVTCVFTSRARTGSVTYLPTIRR